MNIESNQEKLSAKDIQSLHPEIFGEVYKPFKIGILKDFKTIYGDRVSARTLRTVLGFRASRYPYLLALSIGGNRYALDGAISGVITDLEMQDAKIKLEKMRPTKEKNGLKEKLRSNLLKAYELNKLSKADFSEKNQLSEIDLDSIISLALAERQKRREKRLKIVEEFDKSGMSIEDFAKTSSYSVFAIKRALEKIKGIQHVYK